MRRFSRVLTLASWFILTACGNDFPIAGDNSTKTLASQPTVAEVAYCPGSRAVPGTSTSISANALLEKFNDTGYGLTTLSTANIRFAEVQILDSNGALVQCGETDTNGAIGATDDWQGEVHAHPGLSIPLKAGAYRLVVNSRGDNAFVKASIVNNPFANLYYSVAGNFTLTGHEVQLSVTLPHAAHNKTLEGGAFNIFDQLVSANHFLRGNTSCPFCTDFTVAPKVSVFWTPGLTPGTYLGAPDVATSFFNKDPEPGLPTGIYILGGINGSVCTDTDHFDNSVIVHEYGHFMEYSFNKSDSPGGSHTGNGVVDPRLAWSEGWADYFQAEVLGRSFYRDTISNSECGTASLAFPDFILNTQAYNQDIPQNSGEGTFRELATSRSLFKATTSYQFSYIWNTFSDPSTGFANSQFHFKNPGLFFQQLLFNVTDPQKGKATWTLADELLQEDQNTNQSSYALPVNPVVGSCYANHPNDFSFPKGGPAVQGNPAFQVLSNRYFQYDYDGNPAHAQIQLHYTSSSGTPYDLDLYVYQEDYVFGEASDIVGKNANNFPEPGGNSTWPGSESVDLSGKPAGHYMINVLAYTAGGNANDNTYFYLQTNSGEYLCP